MRKIYFSLITIAILLFAACTNDVPGNEKTEETGTLVAKISFEGKEFRNAQVETRAVGSTAIPVVSWDNVKQIQLFLYRAADGTVAFSRTVAPSALDERDDESGTYTWENVPLGTYKLGLLANAKNSTDNVVTTIDGISTEFGDQNVVSKKLENILIGLKSGSLPVIPSYFTPDDWAPRTGYIQPAEIFTAYCENVEIGEGENVVEGALTLKREVALLRARFDIGKIPNNENNDKVNFDSENGFIVIQRLPENFMLTPATFSGGVSASSDVNSVLIGASGANTYKATNPTEDYNPLQIIDTDYTRWQDILVFPNAALSENIPKTDDAADDRKYFIVIAAQVNHAGYVYEDGTIATEDGQPVYWYGIVDGVFTKNVIREVNMTLVTKGYPLFPDEPEGQGGLTITIGAPENWDSEIVSTDINI